MKKFCFIYNIEQTWSDQINEYYDIMSILIGQSIRNIYQDIDIYASFIRNDSSKIILKQHIVNELNELNIIINYFEETNLDDNKDNYYLRHRCIQNYIYLLEKYENIVYVDIDAYLFSKIPDIYFQKDAIIIEEVPYIIKKNRECLFIGDYDINEPLYYNWFQIINNSNKFVYNIKLDTYNKQADVQITKNILNSNLKYIINDQPYYPKKEINNKSFIIHYDSFGEEGSLIFLKDIYPKMFFKLKIMLEFKYKVNLLNNKSFWEKEFKKWKNY